MLDFINNVATALVLVGLFGIWWFIKKQPNTKMLLGSIALAIISFILFGVTKDNIKQSNGQATQVTLETTTTETTTIPTTTTETTTVAETTESKLLEYTDEANAQFANYLKDRMNEQLSSAGMQVNSRAVGGNIVYVYVPQDIKYSTNAEIQEIADTLFNVKENLFTQWIIDNGYSMESNSPALYVKSEDDTTLAKESGILNRKMKREIDN
ncbi:hypothetical protein AB6M97_08980 [Streptococcus hillyeri]|uniref:hypothetical protein n=1 Tax=Streptococcus hillyeri TaxID=2282420 RepID=UPI0034E1B522